MNREAEMQEKALKHNSDSDRAIEEVSDDSFKRKLLAQRELDE